MPYLHFKFSTKSSRSNSVLQKKTLDIIRKKMFFVSNLLGLSPRTQIITPPPDLLLSILHGSKNPSTKNCKFGKESFNFVSVRTNISTYFKMSFFSCLNLLGKELIFRLPMIAIFALLNRRFLIVDDRSKNLSFLILLDN